MKTITFYSYKGGVGRTLALTNMATRLAELGKSVCILDFDLEAPGVPFKFSGLIQPFRKGIVDYLYDFSEHNILRESIVPYSTKVNNFTYNVPINVIPAGNIDSNEYWEKLASIDWHKMFYEQQSQGVKFFIDLKNKIKKELNPDYLLIDSRTGITEISGVSLSILSDHAVFLSVNNQESIGGCQKVMASFLKEPYRSIESKKVYFVLCRLPDDNSARNGVILNSTLKKINAYLSDNGVSITLEADRNALIIHSDPKLELAEDLKIGFRSYLESNESLAHEYFSQIGYDYLKLFEMLFAKDFSEEKLKLFYRIKESEALILQSSKRTTMGTRIELLEKAVSVYEKNELALQKLTFWYYHFKLHDKTNKSVEQLLSLNPNNQIGLRVLSLMLLAKNDFSGCIEICNKLLKIDATDFDALLNKVSAFLSLKRFEDALKYAQKLIELHPENGLSFKTFADVLRKQQNLAGAKDIIFKAEEWLWHDPYIALSLAEIYATEGNDAEFYRNFESAFEQLNLEEQYFLNEEVYHKYLEEPRFKRILESRGIVSLRKKQ